MCQARMAATSSSVRTPSFASRRTRHHTDYHKPALSLCTPKPKAQAQVRNLSHMTSDSNKALPVSLPHPATPQKLTKVPTPWMLRCYTLPNKSGLSKEVLNSKPQKLFKILVVPASEAKGTKIKGPLCYEIQNNCLPDTVWAGSYLPWPQGFGFRRMMLWAVEFQALGAGQTRKSASPGSAGQGARGGPRTRLRRNTRYVMQ